MTSTATAKRGLIHKTVSAALVAEIRRRILDGSFAAGEQLRQDGLAEEFGVSRIPVREALFQLEAEGLVKIVPQRGATVAALSPDAVAEAFELRLLLEPRLLRVSAPRLGAADFARAETILRDYAAAIAAQDVARWGELNTDLHLLLYSHAGRPRSQALVAGLLQECDRYTRLQLSADAAGLDHAQREHAELVRLCRAGATSAAVVLLKAHIDHVAKALAALLRG